MTKLTLNDVTAFTNVFKGLKKPAILLVGFCIFCNTLTNLDDCTSSTTQSSTDDAPSNSSICDETTESNIN